MLSVDLQYGTQQQFLWNVSSSCQVILAGGPRECVDIVAATQENLVHPLELPPLSMAVVPGDRVTLVVDRNAALLKDVLATLWQMLAAHGVAPADVLLLQPADVATSLREDPRQWLPEEVRESVRWKIHDPTQEEACGYLASSAGGERIYLARELLESDLVIPVTVAGFDPVQGYRSPCGPFYPGLSNLEAFRKTHGQGHQELLPEDERPLRQLVTEIGWLLGVQYVIQVVPAAQRRGIAAAVLVGSEEGVSRQAREMLDRGWRVQVPERVETVMAAIPTSQGATTWADLGTALQAARSLVEKQGRIIVLSDLTAEPGPGVQIIREQRSARAALQPLRALGCEDLLTATQLASTADWANVYLLSGLPAGFVEELFCTPLESEAELQRLLADVENCVVLNAAQFTYGQIGERRPTP